MTHDELIRSLLVERYTPTPPPPAPDLVDTPEQQAARRQALEEATNGWRAADPATAQKRRADKHRRYLRRVA